MVTVCNHADSLLIIQGKCTCPSLDMQLDHLAEVEAVDGKCDREREQARTPEEGPEKEPPVLDAFDAAYTELVNGTPKGK